MLAMDAVARIMAGEWPTLMEFIALSKEDGTAITARRRQLRGALN